MDRLESFSQSLNGPWRLTHRRRTELDYRTRPAQNPIRATVPGDVHLDLLCAGLIPDPRPLFRRP